MAVDGSNPARAFLLLSLGLVGCVDADIVDCAITPEDQHCPRDASFADCGAAAATYYRDDDGDGYGTSPLIACSMPPRYAALAADCDDTPETGAAIHPGTFELCDGVDQDCDDAERNGCPLALRYGTSEWGPKFGPNIDLENFSDGCEDMLLIGFDVTYSTDILSVQGICSRTQIWMTFSSPEYRYAVGAVGAPILTGQYGADGTFSDMPRCDANEFVAAIDLDASGTRIHGFGFWCAPLSLEREEGVWRVRAGVPRRAGFWGRSAGTLERWDCPPETTAVNHFRGLGDGEGIVNVGFGCEQIDVVVE